MRKLILIISIATCLTSCGSADSDKNVGPPVIEKLSVSRADGEPVYYNDNQLLSTNGVVKFDSNLSADTIVCFSYSPGANIAHKAFSELDISDMSGDITVEVLARNSYGSDRSFFNFEIINFELQDYEISDYDDSDEYHGYEVSYYDYDNNNEYSVSSELNSSSWEFGTNGNGSGMAGGDPYATERQENYSDY